MNKSIWDLEEFKQYHGKFMYRIRELNRRKKYYDGSIYKESMSMVTLMIPKLYKGIKALYLPFSRSVDIDAGVIPGQWRMDLDYVNDDQLQAFDTIKTWSEWNTKGVLFVHYGAMFGLVGLKVIDDAEAGKVKITAVDPTTFMFIQSGQYAKQSACVICYQNDDGSEYAEVIESNRIRTYLNGELFGYDGREPEFENTLGFIPMVEVCHKENGDWLSESTFDKVIPLLDEVNELASYLADIVKKHSEPQWALIGVNPSKNELVKSGSAAWTLPEGADVKALLPQVDIDGILSVVQEIAKNMKEGLPELSFDELRGKDQIATATIELQLAELVIKVKRCRPNYDSGLLKALRMAGIIGSMMGLSDISSLSLLPDTTFDDDREVIPVDEMTRLDIEIKKADLLNRQSINVREGDDAGSDL